jgi:hypothetical protein
MVITCENRLFTMWSRSIPKRSALRWSPELLKKIGPNLVDSVHTMYRKAVYPYKANFLFYGRKNRLVFEEHRSSTQEEASFSAVKRGTLAVLPSMDIDTSVKQLNHQAAKKWVGYEATALGRLSNNTAAWSSIASVTSKLTPY